MKTNKEDIILMSDNNLETVGGEQESTKIIIEGIKDNYSIGVIQPGLITNPEPNITYYNLTDSTRLKHEFKNPISFLKYISKVKKIINSAEPSIIHTQAQVSFFIVSLLKKVNLISRDIKLIHTERGLYTKYNILFRYIFYFFMKELNTLVTTTNFNMKYWKEALNNRGLTIEYEIIENTAGKIFEEYDATLESKSDKEFTIGFSGRYTDWKNWPLAVEITEQLNSILGEKLKVNMAVGCLDDRSLKETKEMFAYLSELLGKRFEGNINITLQEMNEFYYDLDVFILTSKNNTESFGRTLVEAMSRKTAVFTTDAGGSVEVVGDSSKVLNTAEEFVVETLKLFRNNKALNVNKINNLIRVKKHYSLENNVNKHKQMYELILEESEKNISIRGGLW